MLILKLLIAAICGGALLIIIARRVFAVPQIGSRSNSTALPAPQDAPLVHSVTEQWRKCPGKTGVAPLSVGSDAFAVRMILCEAAVSSIDAQYYIWHRDLTGTLLLDALWRAADRGVRVRLLLDDNGTSGMDRELAALNAHPNAEVRLYNPFNLRRLRLLSYTFDFFRLNRRMHNKSLTVDGAATILGGRNIGDEYFGTGPSALFVDLDVIAVGKIVPEVSADFDRYWASEAVHCAGPILGKVPAGNRIGEALRQRKETDQLADYHKVIESSGLVTALRAGELDLEWTDTVLVSDDPIKGLRAVPREDLLAVRLLDAVGTIESRFDGISPYFVPGAEGVRAFATLRKRAITVRILTNSFEATDVAAVHAGYAKRRRRLLRNDIMLFELQRQAQPGGATDRLGPFGSSGASLHAKTFAVDGQRIFIGSFNFDPRSTTLNTEMGLLIDSEKIANQLHSAFDEHFNGLAWQVSLQHNRLIWRNDVTGNVLHAEPGSNWFKRALITVIGWLPVEWLM